MEKVVVNVAELSVGEPLSAMVRVLNSEYGRGARTAHSLRPHPTQYQYNSSTSIAKSEHKYWEFILECQI